MRDCQLIKKFSNKERLLIYQKALEAFESRKTSFGLCFYIQKGMTKIWGPTINTIDILSPYYTMSLFPEIYKYEPKEHKSYWFDIQNQAKRKLILEKAIKELINIK